MSDEEATQTMYLYTGESLKNPDEQPTEILWAENILKALHAGDRNSWQVFLDVVEFENEPIHPREPSD